MFKILLDESLPPDALLLYSHGVAEVERIEILNNQIQVSMKIDYKKIAVVKNVTT